MSEQLTFELAPPEPPSFANFVAGNNGEAVDALIRMGNGTMTETGLVLWGATGAGKTHLLRATVAAASARGQRALYLAHPAELETHETRELGTLALVAADHVDAASEEAQARLFTLYNTLRNGGGRLLVAGRLPPASLAVREDLRTRLGWGLVYELVPLTDADKPAALVAYARARGFTLAEEVVRYLLAHGRRDMTSLVGTVAALDRESLASKRPVTVPMLRTWLQARIDLDR